MRYHTGLTSYVTITSSGNWRVIVRDLPCMKIVHKIVGFASPQVAMTAAIFLGHEIRVNREAKYYFSDKYNFRVATTSGWAGTPCSYRLSM